MMLDAPRVRAATPGVISRAEHGRTTRFRRARLHARRLQPAVSVCVGTGAAPIQEFLFASCAQGFRLPVG